MDWGAVVTAARDVLFKSTAAQLPVALGCSALLFASDPIVNVMGLHALREQYRPWLGAVRVTESGAIIFSAPFAPEDDKNKLRARHAFASCTGLSPRPGRGADRSFACGKWPSGEPTHLTAWYFTHRQGVKPGARRFLGQLASTPLGRSAPAAT